MFELVEPDPMVRSPGQASTYDDRLNHLLEVSTRLMAREGYQKASMRAVAKATGFSLAGLYHYFDGKERLLFLIQFRTFSSLLNNLQEKLAGVEDPLEQLRIAIRAHVGYFAANMAALKVCSHELDSLTGAAYEETRRIRVEYYRLFRSVIDRVIETSTSNSTLNRHFVAMSLFGTLNWLYRWYDPSKDGSATALSNQILDQFLHGLKGAPDGA